MSVEPRYAEVVLDEATGDVVHSPSEPLAQHIGHVSDEAPATRSGVKGRDLTQSPFASAARPAVTRMAIAPHCWISPDSYRPKSTAYAATATPTLRST